MLRKITAKRVARVRRAVAVAGTAIRVRQEHNEQFVPHERATGSGRTPRRPGGARAIFGVSFEYLNMVNAREGGINRREAHLREVRDRITTTGATPGVGHDTSALEGNRAPP